MSLAYALVGAGWILLSDLGLAYLADIELDGLGNAWKGLGFIAVTASVLYQLLLRWAGREAALAAEQRLAEEALQESERRLAGVLSSMQELAFTIELEDGRISYLNEMADEIFGRPADQLPTSLEELEELVLEEDRVLLRSALAAVLEQGWAEVQIRADPGDGSVRALLIRARAVLSPAGEIERAEGVVMDLTHGHELEELLVHQRAFDQLTGLPNRSSFVAAVEASLRVAATGGDPAVVALFDLDRFATVNESLGHEAGDSVLVAVAARISAALEPGMVAARVGGDEFAVFCPAGLSSPSAVAERLRHAVEGIFEVDGQDYFVSMSVGLAEAGPSSTVGELLRDAHLAMSAAKARTVGVESFEPAHRALVDQRVRVERELRRALLDRRIVTVYQPQLDLRRARIVGVEALVRWQHPSRGLVSAGDFVIEAERSNLIVDLGREVLAQACSTAARWRSRFGEETPVVWVNLSRREIDDPEVVERFFAALLRAGLPASAVGVEITETAFVADTGPGLAALQRLAARGVPVALDDFGTGWSSLQSLKLLPLTMVKIDRSFVSDLGRDRSDDQIVQAVIGMARAMSLQVLAEGVEEQRQLDLLEQLGCDLAQGYLIGHPVPAIEVEAELRSAIDA